MFLGLCLSFRPNSLSKVTSAVHRGSCSAAKFDHESDPQAFSFFSCAILNGLVCPGFVLMFFPLFLGGCKKSKTAYPQEHRYIVYIHLLAPNAPLGMLELLSSLGSPSANMWTNKTQTPSNRRSCFFFGAETRKT